MTMTYLVLVIAVFVVFFLLKRALKIFNKYASKRYPIYFYKDVKTEDIGIPVFVYHSVAKRSVPDSVTSEEFECQMRYLAHNKYHTLDADEFIDHIIYGKPVPRKSVLITFDDGRASLWTAAFPILKEYGLRAVSFLVPAIMPETGIRSHGNGKSSIEAGSPEVDLSNIPTITWDEAKKMHASGLVDFQSHTLEHTLVHVSAEIVDFIHPAYQYGFNNFRVPILRYAGIDSVHSRHSLGTPIYRYQPRMGAARRYFDDEELRNACTAWVESHGGEQFFTHLGWRNDLAGFVKDYRNSNHIQDRFETQEEQALALRYSLDQSKKLIESNLPDHVVRHLAYPWNHFGVFASSLAQELGYISVFIDINPKKFPPLQNNPYLIDRLIPINEFGDDPYMITRLDARGRLVLSLPGKGRISYPRRIITDFLEAPGWLKVER
jgi:peptidoglycan/xylan/chitin deacetylase (PgdA/CDA1 family)